MYKNWPAICAISNPLLRLLVSTTDKPAILRGLERGFPHLFVEEEQRPTRVPFSVLRWAFDQKTNGERHDTPEGVLRNFNVPYIGFGSAGDSNVEVPVEIVGQLRKLDGDKFDFFETCVIRTITYQGEVCLLIDFIDDGVSLEWSTVVLAPAKCIDLNS